MKDILKDRPRNNLVLFLLIFTSATAFYLFNLMFSDLWCDEIYTKSMLDGSFADFYAKFRNDLHPPLYYLGLRLFTAMFGLHPFTLRLFSVVGVLAILLLGYFAGQRVFGKRGALYFCLMLMAVPMLAAHSHHARMYTWAAFATTGLFIYAYLFIRTGKNRDLFWLVVFTVMAMYIHYYSLVAAFVANVYVLLYLLQTRSKKQLRYILSLLLTVVLFLPWLFMFIVQVKKVQHAFWAPEVSFNTITACFTIPFTEQYWTSGYAVALIILMYSLIAFTIFKSFTKAFTEYRLVVWLSMVIFLGTLLVVTVISLFSQPILFSRYVMAIVTMLAVPLTVLFIQMKITDLKIVLIVVILFLGIRVSVSIFYFSYGPYKQTIEYIAATYPGIHKILHLTEITAGPMIEYNGNSGLTHYWLKAEMSNVDAFPAIHQHQQPGEFLQSGEVFCVVQFNNLELNKENLDKVLAQSQHLKTDTVRDNKVANGNIIQVYLLRYQGR